MPYRVNVSSIQSFMQCRFRWWCEWVVGRVPVATAPALDAGRLLHRVFERHFTSGVSLVDAATEECAAYRALMRELDHPAVLANAEKAVTSIEDLIEALALWEDKFPIDDVLEVEEPFEWQDPVDKGILWIGRPDRVPLSGGRIWHEQNRGLAASTNFGTYTRLARRHYHEHLYGEALWHKYRGAKRGRKHVKLQYGGTIFNLVRKLKFRTNVGKKNESTKTAAEMFYQGVVAIDLASPLHRSVMDAMRQHVREMIRVQRAWEDESEIPAPNEKMNGGYSGNSEDPYFRVLIGEVKLSDPGIFKDREDAYADVTTE